MKKIFAVINFFMLLCLPVFANSFDENTSENDYLKIEKNTKQLKTRLSNLYDGYEYTIKNLFRQNVE